MIKNVIFDIGNVLVTFDPAGYFNQYFDEETSRYICEQVFGKDIWIHVDQGLLSEQEAETRIRKQLPDRQHELDILFREWKKLMQEKEESVELMKQLREQGYRIFILSNIGEESYRYCRKHFNFFDLAEGGVYSYQEKLVKPDENIFFRLLERYELLPGECLFFDDSLKNVQQAAALGIHAIQFLSIEKARQEMNEILNEDHYA